MRPAQRNVFRTGRGGYGAALRDELIAQNTSYATAAGLPHALSYGEYPVIVFRQSGCGMNHGNFISASYRAILKRPQWRRRLMKVHSHGNNFLPPRDGVWRELDSCVSSDALLMNIFCYPGITRRVEVRQTLGVEPESIPEFGFLPRVPLFSEAIERTEIDMKLGKLIVEAKLTENDFQIQRLELLDPYRDFKEVFETRRLPKLGKRCLSYQLIRNILAAHALDLDFCTLVDARRPDLIEDWYAVARCIRCASLRTRCKVLTWQELAQVVPEALRDFLDAKYGIR